MENRMNEQHQRELRRNASIQPPAWLDRRILKRIRRRPMLRPFLASGIAVAGLIATVAWLATLYADSDLSLQPLLAAVYTALAYLAICSVATLPLMMSSGRFRLTTNEIKETT
jgi:hypothetical protein